MGKTLIIVAFVVVLIVIVVIAGLHYLRADDDADEFATDPRDDDRLSEEPRGRRGARSGDDEPGGPGTRREIRDLGGSASREAARSRPADQPPAAPSGTGRGSRAATATVERDRAAHDDTDARPAARRDSRRSRANAEVLPPVRPRPSRGKRDDGDWPTSDWDSLSDVDFWHEVAADKPFTSDDVEVAKDSAKPAPRVRRPDQPQPGREERTRARIPDARIPEQPAGPGPARASRADRRQTRRADQGQPRDQRPAKLADAAALDTVAMPQPTAAAPAPPPLPVASAARVAGRMPQPGRGSRPGRTAAAQPTPAAEPTLAMLANMGSGETALARARNDDDPLTSPSFPSIQAADSRSYRRDRSGQYGHPSRMADAGATEQFSRYRSTPAGGSSATAPGSGYRDAADGYRAAQPAPAATARPEPRPDPYPSLPPAAYADDAPYAGREYSEVSMADSYSTVEHRAVRQQDSRSPREALAAVASGDAGYGRRSSSPLPASGQHSYFPGSQPAAGNLLPPVSGSHHRQPGYGDSYEATGTPQPTRRSHGAHAAGNRVGDLTQTGSGYSPERGRRQRGADRYDSGSYPEPASRGSQGQDRVAGYGQTSAGYDAHRAGPGPATWYLGMDPAAQAPAMPRRDDQDPRSAALPRTAGRGSYLTGESAAPVSYPTSYVPGYQPDRYLAAPALPAPPAGGYAGGDPYAADRTGYRGDETPLR